MVLRRLPGDLLVAKGGRRPTGLPDEGLHAADGVRTAGENSDAAFREGNGLAQIAGEPTQDFLLGCQAVGLEIGSGHVLRSGTCTESIRGLACVKRHRLLEIEDRLSGFPLRAIVKRMKRALALLHRFLYRRADLP